MSELATFYYDFSSPYSYLAAARISGLFAEAGVEQPEWQPVSFRPLLPSVRGRAGGAPPDWHPISFGPLLQSIGRRPWSLQPDGANPADLEEVQRRAAERGLPE